MRRLPELLTCKEVRSHEITSELVTRAWKRVYADPNGERDVVDHRAYTFCMLEHLGLDKGTELWNVSKGHGAPTT